MGRTKAFTPKLSALFLSQRHTTVKKALKRKRGLLLLSLILAVSAVMMFFGAFPSQSFYAEAEGYAASVIFDNTTTNYSLFTDAWSVANGYSSNESQRAEVKLHKDVNLSSSLTVTSGKFITLDLNGYKIDRGRGGYVIEVIEGSNFILKDTSPEQTGVVTGGNNSNNGGGIRVLDSTFTLESGTISGNSSGAFGGGIYTERATIYIKGGIISGNTAGSEGAGIEVFANTTCIVTGGIITNNSASNGGGINIYDSSSSVIIAGGIITNNNASSNGGGVCSDNGGSLTVCGDAIITGNVKGGSISNGVVRGGSTNNIYLTSDLIHVGSSDEQYPNNFTGEMGINSNQYIIEAVFGNVAEGATVTGNIFNEKNGDLIGVKSGTDLIWGYDYTEWEDTGVGIERRYTIVDGQSSKGTYNESYEDRFTGAGGVAIRTSEGVGTVSTKKNVIIDDGLTLDYIILSSPLFADDFDGITVTINNLKVGDSLSFTNTGKIKAVYSNGVLTLRPNGSAKVTVEEYQDALRNVIFSTTSDNLEDRVFTFVLGTDLAQTNFVFQDSKTIRFNLSGAGARLYVNSAYNDENGFSIGTYNRPYKTIEDALAAAENGDTIYLLKDITLSVGLSVTKTVTIASEPDAETPYSIFRGTVTGTNMIAVSDGGALTLERITLDGQNVVLTMGHAIVGITGSASSFTMNDGTTITGGTVENACPAVNCANGTFTMNGGLISGNKNEVSTSAIMLSGGAVGNFNGGTISGNTKSDSYAVVTIYVNASTANFNGTIITGNSGSSIISTLGSSVLNFFGGEITENNPGSASTPTVNASDASVTVNIGGSIIVAENYAAGQNLTVNANLIKVISNFTGIVSIFTNFKNMNDQFGIVENGVSINEGDFVNSQNPYLGAIITEDNKLIWGEYKSYTVTFNPNGGATPLESKIVTYNDEYKVLPVPTRVGYTFTGWYTAVSSGSKIIETSKLNTAANHTLYARWTANTNTPYTVEHYQQGVDGGYTWFETEEKTGTSDAAATASAKTYTNFTHNTSHPDRIASGNIEPDGSLVLKLYYDRKTYTVTFNSNSGSAVPSITGVRHEATITPPDAPTKIGYTFAGWYKNSGLTEEFDFDTEKIIAATTIYAKWVLDIYTITYHLESGTNGANPVEYRITDNNFTLINAVKEGYAFSGWFDASGTKVTQITKGATHGNLDLYGYWNTYILTFDKNGGDTPTPATKLVTKDLEYGELAAVTRVGYTFKGWYTSASNNIKIEEDTIFTLTANQTLYAQWELITYDITYHLDGETVAGNPSTYNVATNAITLKNPTAKTGYDFGWYDAPADGNKITSIPKGTSGNIDLYGIWTPKTFTVTFNANNGVASVPASKIVIYDGTYGELGVTSRVGYTFKGWYTSTSGGTKIEEDTIVQIIANQTLYAQWDVNTYNITYHLNGGTHSGTPAEYNYSSSGTTSLTNPTKDGYTFEGWYDDPIAGTKFTNIPKNTTGDLILYARWTAKTLSITFNANGGGTVSPTSKTVTYDSPYGALATMQSGYNFEGWYTGTTGGIRINANTIVKNTGSQTLYAKWSLIEYEIRYNLDGGANGANPAKYNVTTAAFTLKDATKTGYTFNGWYDAEVGGTKITTISKGSSGDKELFARWTPKTFTVTFNINGGGTVSSASKTVTYDSTYGELATMQSGYIFRGWYTAASGGDKIEENTIVQIIANQTLYAQWELITYDITYHLDGGANNASNPATYNVTTAAITLKDATKTGYIFNGWYDAEVGGTKITTISKGSSGDKELFARWTPKTFTVTFNKNGGGTPSPSSKTVTYDEVYGELATVTRDGYIFDGWYTATSGGIKIEEDTIVDITANQTLYAQWILDTRDLQAAIDGVDIVDVSTDGKDIDINKQWTSQGAKDAIENALTTARGVVNNLASTPTQVNSALNTLNNAIATYEAAKSYGKQVHYENADDISDIQPDTVTYDEEANCFIVPDEVDSFTFNDGETEILARKDPSGNWYFVPTLEIASAAVNKIQEAADNNDASNVYIQDLIDAGADPNLIIEGNLQRYQEAIAEKTAADLDTVDDIVDLIEAVNKKVEDEHTAALIDGREVSVEPEDIFNKEAMLNRIKAIVPENDTIQSLNIDNLDLKIDSSGNIIVTVKFGDNATATINIVSAGSFEIGHAYDVEPEEGYSEYYWRGYAFQVTKETIVTHLIGGGTTATPDSFAGAIFATNGLEGTSIKATSILGEVYFTGDTPNQVVELSTPVVLQPGTWYIIAQGNTKNTGRPWHYSFTTAVSSQEIIAANARISNIGPNNKAYRWGGGAGTATSRVVGVTPELNDNITSIGFRYVATPTDIVIEKIENISQGGDASVITIDDLLTVGIENVTEENLDAYRSAIASAANGGLNSSEKIQGMVNRINGKVEAVKLLEGKEVTVEFDYAEDLEAILEAIKALDTTSNEYIQNLTIDALTIEEGVATVDFGDEFNVEVIVNEDLEGVSYETTGAITATSPEEVIFEEGKFVIPNRDITEFTFKDGNKNMKATKDAVTGQWTIKSVQQIAQDKINDNPTNATVEDYGQAGITGVTADNLDRVNEAVDGARQDKESDLTQTEIQDAVDKVLADIASEKAIQNVIDKIDALDETADLEDYKSAVEEAREDYKALTPAQKALVDNLDDLVEAEAKIVVLETEQVAATLLDGKAIEVFVGQLGEDGEKTIVLEKIKALDETDNALVQALCEDDFAISEIIIGDEEQLIATVTFANGTKAVVTIIEKSLPITLVKAEFAEDEVVFDEDRNAEYELDWGAYDSLNKDDFVVILSDLTVEYAVEIKEIQAGVKQVTISFDNNGVTESYYIIANIKRVNVEYEAEEQVSGISPDEINYDSNEQVFNVPVNIDEFTFKDGDKNMKATKDAVTGQWTMAEVVDKTELQDLYDEVKDYVATDYTEATWDDFATALATASIVLDDDNATQVQVDTAKNALAAAKAALTVDKSALTSAVGAANTNKGTALVSADGTDIYPENKWVTSADKQAYEAAITVAKEVLNDADATQSEINDAVNTLATATTTFNTAKQNGTKQTVPGIDKSELQLLVSQVESLTEEDYTPASWAVLASALAEAKTVLSDENATQAQVDAAKNALSAAKTIAQAKAGKLAELGALLASYTKTDYSEENWATLTGYINDAKSAVDDCETIAELDEITIADIEDDCDEVKTKAEETVLAAEAALDAETELNAYVSNPSGAVQAIIYAAVSSITSENYTEVETIIANAKVAIDLQLAKEAKIDELDALLENYDEEEYSETNWTAMEQIIANAKTAVGLLTTVEAVEGYDLDEIEETLDGVETLVQTAAKLAAAKLAKTTALNDLLDTYTVIKAQYSDTNWDTLEGYITDALEDIEEAETIEDVNAIYTTTVSNCGAVETLVQTAARELQEAKNAAIETIDIKKEKYNAYNYGDENYLEILDLIEDAKDDIEQADNSAEIDNILAGLDSDLSAYKIIKESDGKYDKDDTDIDYEEEPDEYFSIVENGDGLDDGVRVIVTKIEITVDESTVSEKRLKTYDILGFGLDVNKKDLKNQGILAKIDISLVNLNGDIISSENVKGVYKISFLLPQSLRDAENIRIVYLDENDEITEVFYTVREGNWITFETEHFSGFYIIGDEEQTINLWWLIILLAVIIILEAVAIYLIKRRDNKNKAAAFMPLLLVKIIPSGAWIYITILAVAVLALAVYLILLFLKLKGKPSESEEEENEEQTNTQVDAVEIIATSSEKQPREINDYSFKARLHLADNDALERYSDFKNYILSYNNVTVKESWEYERFMYGGKSVLKMRLTEKAVNVFFNLDAKEYDGTKYNLEDVSQTKTHEGTPSKFVVNGPRKLAWAKELVDEYMKDAGAVKNEDYMTQDFMVDRLTVQQLISKKLIKVHTMNETYEKIIDGDE